MRWSFPAGYVLAGLAICCVALLVAVILLLQSALSDIAAKSDQLEAQRTHKLVETAFQGQVSRIGAMATDNSAWDAAVESTYGATLDTPWLAENWGPGAEDGKPYDGIFLMDETGRLMWGTFRGKALSGDSEGTLGTGLSALFRKHKAQIDQGLSAYSGVTATQFGPAIISVALIRPAKAPFVSLKKTRRYVILTRHLTPGVVSAIGQSLDLKEFRLAQKSNREPTFLRLVGEDGSEIGRIVWAPSQSGAEAAGAGREETTQTVLLVAVLVATVMVLVGIAIHQLISSERRARHSAQTDPLSKLPNRRAFYEALYQLGVATGDIPTTVVFIDLDGFKSINDAHGHATGDALIRQLAILISKEVPDRATFARMGGDEFALLASGPASAFVAGRFAEVVSSLLSRPIRVGTQMLKAGASIGIASADIREVSPDELVRRADAAMYHAKETGRRRIVEYSAVLEEAMRATRDIEDGILHGLERNEFEVVYQPVVEVRGRTVVGVEALLRWPRRPAGALPPDAFIPIAEKSGHIQALGLFVLEQACRDLVSQPRLKLSVNVSPVQFDDAMFEFHVVDILERTGFPPQRLELEMTEGHLINNAARAVDIMTALREKGVSFSLDDFGTGYSSIGYLKQFQFDRIKIDRSLAGQVNTDKQAGALVAGAVHLAKALSMAVTAEGVETDELAKMLKLAGCTDLQGYLFGKPGPYLELLNLLESREPGELGAKIRA